MKTKILLLGVIFIPFIFSCNKALVEKPYSAISLDNFYTSTDQANVALAGIYYILWQQYLYKDGAWLDLNDVTGGALESYPQHRIYDSYSWSVDDPNLEGMWSALYQGINRANVLLDKLQNSNVADKNDIMGQALFLRGLFYFDLVVTFGGVPIYTHGTYGLDSIYKPRSTADEVYAQIISDLTQAASLMSPYNESNHQAGMATSGAALALLADVYAQHRDWANAAKYAKQVIDMGVFGLDADYEHVFDPAFNNDKEKIFSIQHINGGDATSEIGEHLVYLASPQTATLPDGTNVQFFLNLAKSVDWVANRSFFASTPATYRRWYTMRDKMPFYYKSGSTTLTYDTVDLPAPFIVKYYHLDPSTGTNLTGVDFPIIRYSDVLLKYAEALNEVNHGPTSDAYNAINMVRERARAVGTPYQQPASVYPDLSNLTYEQFRDSVLTEEEREFVGEGHRRLDLLRHGLFISDAIARGITSATPDDTLFPIPAEEISKNPKLTQNPGY
ncbi:MAG: RagB/SusD family nutrient uptake outer membrane protein [Acidobacterium ailaaui]|nr:RagB/SusD family nutrient uptake outer membrane protein [Pseudacidobacterium ailaaui]